MFDDEDEDDVVGAYEALEESLIALRAENVKLREALSQALDGWERGRGDVRSDAEDIAELRTLLEVRP